MFDETCGNRVLTVLNSWAVGSNIITQDVPLTAGSYRLLLDMRYECTNETLNNGKTITTSGNNTNTSLTGIKIGTGTDYRYPTQSNTWQQLCYDFTLDNDESVTISLGFSSSANVGAANNSLLYIDNVRLLASNDNVSTAIYEHSTPSPSPVIYDLQGRRVNASALSRGIYVQEGKKRVIISLR